jgi:putative membrane-bound dehydrogenase-like protein
MRPLGETPMHPLRRTLLFALLILTPASVVAGDGNRLAYLDELNLYYPSRKFPRLVTPQWVGEDGVEAVVVLAIDDMRGHKKWETFLRPILQRLKRIDGRAPVSIMTCQIDPREPHLQKWLKEGLSLETHTVDHPCPILRDANLKRARDTFDRCVDMLAAVPNSKPVAFRTPCCDSLNTVSPRFFAEIFNKKTPKGNFLTLDSSVFNVTTPNDPALPRKLVLEADGSARFAKYLPRDRTFVNTIEDYPYPYVIGRLCWEFPCATPSDWAAQHLHGPNNPKTVRDWKALLDATVIKQGVFNLVFHPHGWISNEQVVDFIDYAAKKYGKRVKFLTFRECQERLNKNLLGGHPLRDPKTGQDNGVRLLDVDYDGYMDVVIGNDKVQQTRLWSPKKRTWVVGSFPRPLVSAERGEWPMRFGIFSPDGSPSLLWAGGDLAHIGGWHFDGKRWVERLGLVLGLYKEGLTPQNLQPYDLRRARLLDLDRDGVCELIVDDMRLGQQGEDFVVRDHAIFKWSPKKERWTALPFTLPPGIRLFSAQGQKQGVRFVDLNGDGFADLVYSDEKGYGVYLFTDMKKGWSRKVMAGKAGDKDALPMISRGGSDNGCWAHSRGLWWQNENTSHLKDLVARRSFNELLKDVEPAAKSPQASLRCLKARPGFKAELVVSEPLVQSPIAFAWGPDGKLWVVEMGDYPLGVDGKGKPGGRIKFLESTKGNGIYDKATVFLDNLPFPTGVLPWRKGVLVTCAPDIFYAEDTDGDGKADKKVVLYTGFVEGNQQHRVNTLAWGLDNWIYVANGDSGGRIKSVKTGKVVNISGRDLRIRPDTGDLDTVTGGTQYGRSRDDWGNWFGGNNSNPMWHYPLADHYLRRNPFAAPPPVRVPVSVRPGAAPVFPISRTLPRFNDPGAANHFTSACSPIVYRDELFSPAFAGNCFISEPVHNLVHREIMSAKGVTFSSRRAADEQRSEFLASSDNWCRPTTIRIGPDGALWVADMYRAVIEHPQWIPKDWQKRLDLRAGHDKGRIYRVFPVGKKPRAIPRLDKLDTAGRVAALDSPSGYQRDLAQQMLLWRQDKSAVPLLEKLARKSERPLARLHAFCTLDGLNALTPALLRSALADAHPGVRRHAVRLCEAHLAKAPKLGDALVKLVGDGDAQVRMQLAFTLGEWDDPRAGQALGELAVRDRDDPYLLAAVASSVNKKNLDRVLLGVLRSGRGAAPPAPVISRLLLLATAMGQKQAMATLLAAVAAPDKEGMYAPWQYAALAGLLDSLDQRNTSLAQLAQSGAEEKTAVARLAGLFSAARAAVADVKAPLPARVQAVPLLARGLDRDAQDVKLLGGLLVPQVPPELRSAAVSALGRLREPEVPALLLRGWGGYGPQLRSQVLDVLSRRGDWQNALLAAVEKKQVQPAEVDAARRQRLLHQRDAALRRRAEKAFAGAVDPDRQKVVESYRSVARLKGDTARGLALFKKNCAICHKLGDVGKEVGPDLASLADKSTEALLVAILDPNRAVEARYVNYFAETKNGLTLSGVLTSETGNSITLVGPDGKEHVILRANLASLTSTGKSAMPEGIEKELKPQDLADLIALLRATRSPAKPPP